MFYFLFKSRGSPKDDPVVIWMTGGPGCSSEIAVFYENGPYTLEHNLTLSENPYGWDVNANMIYVDQPINTGFSYSDSPRDRVTSESIVADDMLDFLQEFMEAHPELAENEVYITGESYAGHYVPAVANRVYRAKELGEGTPINIKGAAIGNGLTAPAIQFGAYADFAEQNGIISKGNRDSIQWFMPLCRWGANLCQSTKWGWVCGLALEYCQLFIFQRVLMAKPGINVYDIRKDCEGPLCYDFSDADAYLNSKEVRSQLGITDKRRWEECNMDVHADFFGDFMRDYQAKLVPLLEDDVRVLIYAGDQDLICNYLGNRRWVDQLEWSGKEKWAAVEDKEWYVKEGEASNPAKGGTAKTVETLSFVRVYQAGHMVPMDQPAAALQMITRWIRNQDLATGKKLAGGRQQRRHQQPRMVTHREGKQAMAQQ